MGRGAATKTDRTRGSYRRSTTERYYFSQCVKDETMAEAIAAGFARRPDKLVVQSTGHSTATSVSGLPSACAGGWANAASPWCRCCRSRISTR